MDTQRFRPRLTSLFLTLALLSTLLPLAAPARAQTATIIYVVPGGAVS